MKQKSGTLGIATKGCGFIDITGDVERFVSKAEIATGLLTIFARHTSASLLIQENADPDVLADLEEAFRRLAPRDAPYCHRTEGPDDMPAHIRAALLQTSLSIPVTSGRAMLGTWQAIYLVEHRDAPHKRDVVLHLIGE